jgi:hypothetical protein
VSSIVTYPARTESEMSRKELRRRRRWDRDGYGFAPLCYLCQQIPATTDDHVPPRGLFASNHGADAYCLPACESCNGLLTEDEEYLRNVLANSGRNREASSTLKMMLRSFQGSSPLYPFDNRSLFYRNAGFRDLLSPGGIWRGRLRSFEVSRERIEPVVVKIVRGLHFRERKSAILPDVQFEVFPFFPPDTAPFSAWLSTMHGKVQFTKGVFPRVLTYVGWQVHEHPESSMWALVFYESTGFAVMAESRDLHDREESDLDGLIVRPRSPEGEEGPPT